ncbi:MAG: PDZ domain-containing protein [Oscillospiraceae bacterium]|nr:PDZ domain-containing protein [Oscillospiraceae bacterium]
MKHREEHPFTNEYRTGGSNLNPLNSLFTAGVLVLAVVTAVLLSGALWLLQAEPLSSQKSLAVLNLSEETRNPADSLYMEGEVVTCTDIGFTCQGISDFCKKLYALPMGVYVIHVDADSAAAKLGILPGDILVRVNEKPLRTPATLQNALNNCPSSGIVALEFYRKEKTFTVYFTPGDKIWN